MTEDRFAWIERKCCFHFHMFATYIMHLKKKIIIILLDETHFSLTVKKNSVSATRKTNPHWCECNTLKLVNVKSI